MKYKILTAILLTAMTAMASDLDYAYRLPAELQTPGPQALEELTWQQGSTPLIQVEVLRRGRPIDGTNQWTNTISNPIDFGGDVTVPPIDTFEPTNANESTCLGFVVTETNAKADWLFRYCTNKFW